MLGRLVMLKLGCWIKRGKSRIRQSWKESKEIGGLGNLVLPLRLSEKERAYIAQSPVGRTCSSIETRAVVSITPNSSLTNATHLLDCPMDKESRIASFHFLDYPFISLLVSDIVSPGWQRDRDRMSSHRRYRRSQGYPRGSTDSCCHDVYMGRCKVSQHDKWDRLSR